MSELAHTMIVCGLLSGTQPLTVMGMLIVLGGSNGRRNAWLYVLGAFTIQAIVVLISGFVIGATVEETSSPGRSLVLLRIAAGVVLLVLGWRFRQPAGKPVPEVPKVLNRLTNLRPSGAFIGGVAIADYTGAMLAAAALSTSTVHAAGAIGAWILYCLLATGLPVAALVAVTRSARAERDLNRAIAWVMSHRRQLTSWICFGAGLALVADGTWSLLVAS